MATLSPPFTTDWLFTNADQLAGWLLNAATWMQGGLTLLMLLLAQLCARHSATWVESKLKARKNRPTLYIYTPFQTIFFAWFFALFLWLAVLLARALGLDPVMLSTLANLALAWAVIRLTSSVIESPFWSRLVAITLWVIAALNIVGLLEPTIQNMDAAAVTFGKVKISMLLVVKSVLAFVVLFWAIGLASRLLQRSFNKAKGLNPSQRVLFFKLSNIALYAIAIIVGLQIVGLDLTALTVFSGALGLGIGFGLQKVFSNLISGIILLLDKSVKPGDVIAIGDTYGWVNSLGARCVSVLTRDGKEHLIPNENLITQNVENWSYSDKNIRVHIPVTVSYQSDLYLVRKLLLEALEGHPRVLATPAPRCLISNFGENGVEHQLRAWIADPQDGVGNIKSDIYYRIWDLFKANNIQIPSPQREIRLRNVTAPAVFSDEPE